MNLTRFELKDLIFRTLKDIKRVSRGAGDIFYADVANVDISDVYNTPDKICGNPNITTKI